jgi:hypothetical protein
MCPWGTGSELDQTSGDGSVTSSDESAAGFADLVLSHRYTVASFASVGIHAKAMITDAADFGAEVAHAHFAGLAFGQALTALQCLEDPVRLGFGIDQFHSISFL